METVITYGAFDLLLGISLAAEEAQTAGNYLIVGLSTDRFNWNEKQKNVIFPMKTWQLLEAIRYVDLVIPEENWERNVPM